MCTKYYLFDIFCTQAKHLPFWNRNKKSKTKKNANTASFHNINVFLYIYLNFKYLFSTFSLWHKKVKITKNATHVQYRCTLSIFLWNAQLPLFPIQVTRHACTKHNIKTGTIGYTWLTETLSVISCCEFYYATLYPLFYVIPVTCQKVDGRKLKCSTFKAKVHKKHNFVFTQFASVVQFFIVSHSVMKRVVTSQASSSLSLIEQCSSFLQPSR